MSTLSCATPANVHSVHTVPAALFRRGLWSCADLDHHTCPFCKIQNSIWNPSPNSHANCKLQIANCKLHNVTNFFLKAAELVSELETLTKRLSKPLGHSCLFTQLPSISESKAVTRIKLMIMVFEYTTGREHSRSTEKKVSQKKRFFREDKGSRLTPSLS